jgi:hypothetical protein
VEVFFYFSLDLFKRVQTRPVTHDVDHHVRGDITINDGMGADCCRKETKNTIIIHATE